MPQILVTDANILIDLALINEHELLLLPTHEVETTYDIYYELKPEQRVSWKPYVDDGRLTLEEVSPELVAELRASVPAGLSDPDCTVIILAERREAIIVSGDRLLVKTYRNRGKEAHGILWLLDENDRVERYDAVQLHAILTAIMKVNQWIPAELCQERLELWRSKDPASGIRNEEE